MPDFAPNAFSERPDFTNLEAVELWFSAVADVLLNRSLLSAGRARHRILEIEVYYSSPDHPDPFAHCFPIQREFGRWYFHRIGQSFRGGSYKGVDLTFGDGTAYTGILIRTIELPDGTIVNGPSLLVDHLLKATAQSSIATLDRAIAGRSAWDQSSPLHLAVTTDREAPAYRTARVGLSLKRFAGLRIANDFLERRYRFLTEPGRVIKGKRQTVHALHHDGWDVESISRLTQCRAATVLRYITETTECAHSTEIG